MTDTNKPMVYISSDPKDTGAALYTLNRVVMQLDGLPVQSYYMEGSGSYDWPLVRSLIDECDVYVLIVGDSYGAISDTGESFIHREAVYAKSKRKPVVAILKNAELKALSAQSIQRLKSLHRLMMSGTFKYWNNKEDLLLIARQVLRDHLKPQLNISSGAIPNSSQTHYKEMASDSFFEQESYPLRFTGKVFAHGNCHEVTSKVLLSWTISFINIGSMMTSPVTEDRMRGALEDLVEESYRDQFLSAIPDSHALADVRCNENEFQRLKAYLKSAGVIENVDSGSGGIRNYWQLTSSGEQRLNKLLMPG
jgi:hypothetical protein